jgi:CheY-like chemotaxis protein
MKILYVEDNDDNVYMLKNRLSRAGFTVVVATDGTQGIAMAASEQPDLILMDLTLPDIRGEEATQRIKADPATKQIPVIALTANAMAGDREKALAAGCDDFDTKPVEMSRLLEKIKALKPHRTPLDRKHHRHLLLHLLRSPPGTKCECRLAGLMTVIG